MEGIAEIFGIIFSETHLLITVISLVRYNARKILACVDWEAEQDRLHMHFLRRLCLELKIWYITVDDKAGDIYFPISFSSRDIKWRNNIMK